MRLLQRVCPRASQRRARPESRAPGVRLQAHLGILHRRKTRKAAGFPQTGVCLVSMDFQRSVPGNPSAVCERPQLGMELQIFPAVAHPATPEVERRRTDVSPRSLLMDIFPTRVLDGTQSITVLVEIKQCLEVSCAIPSRRVDRFILRPIIR